MLTSAGGELAQWAVLSRVERKLCQADGLELGALRVLVRVAALTGAGLTVRSKDMQRVTRVRTWHAARVDLVKRGLLAKVGIPGTGGRGRAWVLTEAGHALVVRFGLALAQAVGAFLRGAE